MKTSLVVSVAAWIWLILIWIKREPQQPEIRYINLDYTPSGLRNDPRMWRQT